MSDFDSKLASQCQGLASCLSYNAEHYEGEAKHITHAELRKARMEMWSSMRAASSDA